MGSGLLSYFSREEKKTLASDGSFIEFSGISSVESGKYRICYNHVGGVYDVGTIEVRPSCAAPLVMVGGTCVEHCPRNKIPSEGECRRDPLELGPESRDDQAVKIAIRMDAA